MERAVELVGFNHHIVTRIRKDIIGSVVLGNTTEESIAIHVRLMQDVCNHRRSGCLAMSSCHAKSFVLIRQKAQYLRTLLNLETVLTEKDQFLMFGRNGWCIDHQGGILILETILNQLYIFLIMNQSTFLNEALSQFTWSFVVTSHVIPLTKEIAEKCTHADATCTNKVN